MKKAIAAAALVVALAFPAVALAAPPENPSCWGASAAALAQSATGAMGAHASSFAGEPRLGIGNVAYLFTGTHQPGELAALLGGSCD